MTGWFHKDCGTPTALYKQFEGKIQYWVGQKEITKKGKLHWQTFIQFKKKIRPTALHKMFPPGVWNNGKCDGTAAQNKTYCTKDETSLGERFEFGEMMVKGKAGKLAVLARKMKEGSTYKELWEDETETMILRCRNVKEGLAVLRRPITTTEFKLKDFTRAKLSDKLLATKAVVLYGSPGSGKTSFALAHFVKPLLIRDINDLRELEEDPTFTGLVFDEVQFLGDPPQYFGRWSVGRAVVLVDLAFVASIRVLYGTVKIPPGMPRIFCTNEPDGLIFPEQLSEQFGVLRRVLAIKVPKLFR